MAAELLTDASRATDANSNPYAGAVWSFYATGTTTPQAVYADAALSTSLGSTVTADAGGHFVPIYFDASKKYRGILKNATGSITLNDIDPINSGIMSLLSGPTGSSAIGFLQSGTGAVARTLQDKARETVSALDFGALGNCNGTAGNGNDDAAAIQAALDYIGNNGGGEVRLPKTSGNYRISTGLKVPPYTTLRGAAPVGYPYQSGAGVSALVADFSNANQWVLEAKTLNSGSPYAYNTMVSGALPSAPAYNCGVHNLLIRSVGTAPFGGVRMHGAPKSRVSGVGITGVGCGLLVNYSFGGVYEVHVETLYYGVAGWDDVNGCKIDFYAAQDQSVPATVPAGYQLSFMAATAGTLVGSRAMAVEHSTRPYGFILGSTSSSSTNNELSIVSERFKGGIFMLNANGAQFNKAYIEGTAMEYAVAAASATFKIPLHAFMSGVGTLFDLGAGISGTVEQAGIVTPASFGTGPYSTDASFIKIPNARPSGNNLAPTTPRVATVKHGLPGPWVNFPAAASGTNNATYPPAYRINGERLELRGFATGASTSTTIWTLPVGYRPTVLHNLAGGFGSQIAIDTTGTIQMGSGTVTGLDGVSFPLT